MRLVRRKALEELEKAEQSKSDLEKEMPEVDAYFGTTDLPQLLKALGADYKHELLGERVTTTPKNYAYFKVSEGCDRPCSFCAIPLMRGKHRSTPIEELILRAEKLAQTGVKELILIAQDLTYYGLDLYKKRRLADLLLALVKVEGIEWIRLHYAFPSAFPMEVIEVMRNESKICNYLDIPLQHISDKILKSMRRGAGKNKINNLITKIREKIPGIALRTTLIVGYPGEKIEDFEELCEWVKQTKFDRLGCFTYSHEENTHAYSLEDDVSDEDKKLRQNTIMKIQSEISSSLNKEKIGKIIKCIIDRFEDGYYIGRTEFDSPDVDNNVLIKSQSGHLRIGEFYDVKVNDSTEYDLIAEIV